MPRKPPTQKPGKSETVVRTPRVFLDAVLRLLDIEEFYRDLAASFGNHVADVFYTKEDNGLVCKWGTYDDCDWNWLNPPYDDIAPWVHRACAKKAGAQTAVLVPASTGSNWWRDYVHQRARVKLLNGRITFDDKHGKPVCSQKTGKPTPYPKDLALLLYSSNFKPGYDVWSWKK
jgi:phage N-6-adenine-methyltransferase